MKGVTGIDFGLSAPSYSGEWMMAANSDLGRFTLLLVVAAVLPASPIASAVELGREVVAAGFDNPVFMTAPPGDTTRLFVVEQDGKISIVNLSNNQVLISPFLNIGSKVDCCGERGLLGMAFHPNYNSNGRFFLYYMNDDSGLESRIVRYTANSPFATSNTADPNSEVILLTFDQPQSNHNAGMLAFGPNDGYLYIASGDGGGGGDNDSGHDSQLGNGQALDTFLGKILRIDVDEGGAGAGTGGANYDIPSTNPNLGAGSLPETWAYGLRNPYRFGFDRDTGDLYIGDVGQNKWEEIDFQPAASFGGVNYGWRIVEGPECFNPTNNCDETGLTPPIHSYDHQNDGGRAVIGGYPYRGADIPFFEGHYIYSDIPGIAKSFLVVNGTATLHQDWEAPLQTDAISSFGEDANGELYFAILDTGTVYKIIPTDNDVVWVDFFASGLMKGSELNPLNLLDIGLRSVADGGQINLVGVSMDTTSSETLTIDQPVTLTAVGGTVTIGSGARSAGVSVEGFVSQD